ncbi:unnamed protein product [Caenorhabditis angaria]|uniref:Anaphase-promoting complex subunit 10 n=1 Tax=Caenorhabditis angaria TaxID=860376 RepID=A0A9P1IWT0_9PELO|nr:unnamed protein product [Caenorhabditis angaria]
MAESGERTSDGSIGWQNNIPFDVKPRDNPLRDVSQMAVWTLSSCKHGYGVSELLNDSVEKYWQSDGPQPHTITIEFQKKTDVSFIMIYLDFKNDESYTPSKIVAKMGSSQQDFFFKRTLTLTEPQGWQVIDMRDLKLNPQRGWLIQLQVVQNHQNGRDTHIRHVRIIGPSRSRFCPETRLLAGNPMTSYDFPAKMSDDAHQYMDQAITAMALR